MIDLFSILLAAQLNDRVGPEKWLSFFSSRYSAPNLPYNSAVENNPGGQTAGPHQSDLEIGTVGP